ncbi:MAG: DUF3127 domain-containing protein [Bacteroidetes bacterium]|jgi:hypothetical protein|nr:DUF3127 domain-containing protein [Bacteroidota bacterium]
MSFQLAGTIIDIFDENQVTDKFKKREFVVETSDNGFTEQIKFQLVQDKTNLIEGFQTGQPVKVHFNIKGNKWKDNYFVNLQVWRIEAAVQGSSGGGSSTGDSPSEPPSGDIPPMPDSEDDLPF